MNTFVNESITANKCQVYLNDPYARARGPIYLNKLRFVYKLNPTSLHRNPYAQLPLLVNSHYITPPPPTLSTGDAVILSLFLPDDTSRGGHPGSVHWMLKTMDWLVIRNRRLYNHIFTDWFSN